MRALWIIAESYKINQTGVFGGEVYVAQEARDTQSDMKNRNLLLSDHARINTKPVLEIYNEDVQCSHSATSGCLDNDKTFYIQSRGIEEADAMNILIRSFASEIIEKIKNSQMKKNFSRVSFCKNCNKLKDQYKNLK